ncbi:MAG: GumC family protein [Geminicoccaceae bacterium]
MVGHWLNVLLRNKLLIAAVTLVVTVIGGVIVATQPKIYEASSTILVRFGQEYLYIPSVGDRSLTPPASLLELVNAEMQIMSTSDLKLQVIEEVGLDILYPDLVENPKVRDEALLQFGKDLFIATDANSHVIHVWFRHGDPEIAARTVNIIIDHYLDKRQKIFTRLEPADWDTRVAAISAELKTYQTEVDAFQREHGLYAADSQIKLSLNEKREIEAALQNSTTRLRELENDRDLLTTNLNQLSKSAPSFVELDKGPAIDRAIQAYIELALQRQQLEKELGRNHPQLINVRSELGSTSILIKQLIDGQLTQVAAQIALAGAEQNRLQQRLAGISQGLAGMSRQELLLREMELALDLKESEYRETLAKRRQASLEETNVRVIEPATPPTRAIGATKKLRLILVGLIGLCLAIGSVALRELLRPSLSTAESVEKHLGLPVLASFSTKDGG